VRVELPAQRAHLAMTLPIQYPPAMTRKRASSGKAHQKLFQPGQHPTCPLYRACCGLWNGRVCSRDDLDQGPIGSGSKTTMSVVGDQALDVIPDAGIDIMLRCKPSPRI